MFLTKESFAELFNMIKKGKIKLRNMHFFEKKALLKSKKINLKYIDSSQRKKKLLIKV